MNIIEGDYKAKDGKDYYWALIDKRCKFIRIFKNFSCIASIYKFIEKDYELLRYEMWNIFKVEYLGNSINLNRISKKYSKFEII